MAETCKVITLKGDKRKPESATHIIEFPGGSIELSRTSNNEYWAHISVNRGQIIDDADGYHGDAGRIVTGRIDRTEGHVEDLPGCETIHHLAVRIAVGAI